MKNTLLLVLVVITIIFAFILTDITGTFKSSAEKTVIVPKGAGTAQIAVLLKENKLIRSELLYKTFHKLVLKKSDYKPGEFTVRASDSYRKINNILNSAPNNMGIKVTIPEGYELRQIADTLEKANVVKANDFINACSIEGFDYWFLKDIPKRDMFLEGYLFPDTYYFNENMSSKEVIKVFLDGFDDAFSDDFKKRSNELNMSVDEIITLASVIEREAQKKDERKIISSVFHNRLKDNAYPYLESCATVQYILKEHKAVLSVADTKINSPYNTYIHKGLPIGPISSPGKASIVAALYPEDTDYKFFVANNDGSHDFSKTYEEHAKKVSER